MGRIIEKWDDITAGQIANMSDEERSAYYHELYQTFGSLMGVTPPTDLPEGHEDRDKMRAVTDAYESLLDAIAELAAYEG